MPYIKDSTDQTMNKSTEAALSAIQRGFQPIPLATGEKSPRGVPGWTRLRWENTPEGLDHAKERFEQWADEGLAGVGVLLGDPSDGLVDIDLDHPKASRLKDHFLPPTPARSGRTSRPGSHYWYKAKPGTLQSTRAYKLGDRKTVTVEYRSTGGQTALPGSIHPSGEIYEWASQPWGGDAGPTVVDGRVLAVQVALLGFCTLLVDSWATEGSRHEAFLALAGGLLRVGDGVHPYWERNAHVIIAAISDATNDNADERISETVETTLKRLRSGQPVAGFGKLSEIVGEETVKQARVILGEIESAAGLPSRDSGTLTIEKIRKATTGEDTAEELGPATHEELAERVTGSQDNDDDVTSGLTRDPLEERLGSWDALDLDPYLHGQVQTVEPSVLERTDGQALLYSGRLNMLYGPSEAAKSWISMYTCIQMMERGERVVYLDFEDEPVNALDRMKLLGASYDDLRRGFQYVRPEEPLAPMQRSRWGEPRPTPLGEKNNSLFQRMLEKHDPALIVADGMTVLYGLHGLDSNDSVQTDTITSWLKSLTRNGRTTVLVVDHTAKNPQRGSMPIGSQHKVSMVQGALLQTYPVRQPMPGAVGEVELIVLKDRPGKVRAASQKSGEKAQLAARVFMDSTTAGQTTLTVESPSIAQVSGDGKTEVELDLSRARAAERAEMRELENRVFLDVFDNELGRGYRKSEIIGRIDWSRLEGEWTSKRKSNMFDRTKDRLMESGWVVREGKTQGAVYYLAVADV